MTVSLLLAHPVLCAKIWVHMTLQNPLDYWYQLWAWLLHHSFLCPQELVTFHGLLFRYFCLCYPHFYSICNLPGLPSPSFCLSYFLSLWTPVLSSDPLGFYIKRLIFCIHYHQAQRFLISCWRTNQSQLIHCDNWWQSIVSFGPDINNSW